MGSDLSYVLFVAQLLSLLFSVILGQPVGVSLQLQGQTIPNNSVVNLDDLLYRTDAFQPTNANGLQTLMCVTDLVDCCENRRLGNWYFPDGRIIVSGSGGTFQVNRGQNEAINNQQFYGSVRLWRRYTPPERGLFRCEIPDAQNNHQNFYVNILQFTSVAISSSGSTTAGEMYSLSCSATLRTRNPPLPDPNIPSPTFEWLFGPNGNVPLPSGLTPTVTLLSNDTYISTLEFSPLSQSHAGMYTCRLGAGGLVNNNTFAVTAPPMSATITANFNTPLMVGQTGNTLICVVSGADRLNPIIAYQWTRNDSSTQTQVGTNTNTLTLSSIGLSDAGIYTCSAVVTSGLLSSSVVMSSDQIMRIQIPDPQSVTVTSNSGNIVGKCSTITVTCTVELGPAVIESELSLLLVDVQLTRDGTPLTLGSPTVIGTTLIFNWCHNQLLL